MPRVKLPRLLGPATGDRFSYEVAGGTVGEVVDELLEQEPRLRPHLFDEKGDLRIHVRCFVDGASTDLADRSQRVGGEVVFVQAVSGG